MASLTLRAGALLLSLAVIGCGQAPQPVAAQAQTPQTAGARQDPLPGVKLSLDQLREQMFHVGAGRRLKPPSCAFPASGSSSTSTSCA